MQVSCSSCGAKYEFDASAIPAAGYDAQCTTCNAVFFVSPEADRPQAVAAPAPSEQVAVSCNHCGAVYQFAAADIPAEGYDAQCTQCQGVFFVSAAGAAKVGSAAASMPGLEVALAHPADPTPAVAMAAAAPADAAAAHDIPIADEADYASMSQVIAMERLQAQQWARDASQAAAAPGAGVADAVASASDFAAPAPVASAAPAAPAAVPLANTDHAAERGDAGSDVGMTPGPAPETTASVGAAPGLLVGAGNGVTINPTADVGTGAGTDAGMAPDVSATPTDVVTPVTPAATRPVSPVVEAVAPDADAAVAKALEVADPSVAQAAATGVPSPEVAAQGGTTPGESAQLDVPPPPPDVAPAASAAPAENPAGTGPSPAGTALEFFSLSPGASLEPSPVPAAPREAPAPDPDRAARFDFQGDDTHVAPAPKRRGPWRSVAASVVCVAAVGVGVGVFQARQVPEAMLAVAPATAPKAASEVPPAGTVVPAISPKALIAFERGMRSLLEDTDAGYTAAQAAFQEALKIEPQMADAHAGAALQALMAATDLLDQGHMEAQVAELMVRAVASGRASPLKPTRSKRPKDVDRMHQMIAELAAKQQERATQHLRAGEELLRNGALILWRGNKLPQQTPLLQATAALWLASDPAIALTSDGGTAALSAARTQFAEAAQWLLEPGDTGITGTPRMGANANDPWARTWLSLAKARILAAKPTTAVQVQPVLQAAVAREAHFMRGRWEAARGLAQTGQWPAAQKATEELLTLAPGHEKAAFLKSLAAEAPATQDWPAQATEDLLKQKFGKERARGLVESLKGSNEAAQGTGATPAPRSPRAHGHRGKRAH